MVLIGESSMPTLDTKAKIFKWCEDHGIDLSISYPDKFIGGSYHVHADIVAPNMIFARDNLHNLALWESEDEAPNWRVVGVELMSAEYGPCGIPNCEYCSSEGDANDET